MSLESRFIWIHTSFLADLICIELIGSLITPTVQTLINVCAVSVTFCAVIVFVTMTAEIIGILIVKGFKVLRMNHD